MYSQYYQDFDLGDQIIKAMYFNQLKKSFTDVKKKKSSTDREVYPRGLCRGRIGQITMHMLTRNFKASI